MRGDAKKGSLSKGALDLGFDVAGGFMMSVGTQCFSAPNQIAPGGVTGLSIVVNHLTGLPISALALAMNIPLLILARLILGRGFTLRTMKSVLILAAMLQIVDMYIPEYRGDTILAALYGGVLSGGGLSLVFMRASTTGGTDIIARLIQRKLPAVPVGRLMLGADAFVLLTAAIVYRRVETALFALISIFTSSHVLDSILYGLDNGRVLMIVTEHHSRAAELISEHVGRGCTLLSGKGAYTGVERPVLLCAVRKSQVYEVKRLVFGLDGAAFIMAMEAGEIIGNGFGGVTQPK